MREPVNTRHAWVVVSVSGCRQLQTLAEDMLVDPEGACANWYTVESAFADFGEGLFVRQGHYATTGPLDNLSQEGCPGERRRNFQRVVVDLHRC